MFKVVHIAMILLVLRSPSAICDVCDKWFAKQKIRPGNGCLVECVVAPVDMGTFSCHQDCPGLCKTPLHKEALFRIAYYPGLSQKEYALISEYPEAAIKVFQFKGEAEDETSRIFKRNHTNDESDAFRHFLWAGLLTKSLGDELAIKFLNAHESKGNSSEPEKAMDLANNRLGVLAAQQLIKAKTFSLDVLSERGLKALKSKELIVLSPRGPPQ